MANATVLINNTAATGTDSMTWNQDILSNTDSSLVDLWLLGSAYNRTIISGVTTKDYVGTRTLTVNASPTVNTTYASLTNTNFYSHTATVADLADGGSTGVALNKAIGSLFYGTSPTQIANNDTLTVNGVAITFKTSGASGTQQVNIGSNGTVTFTAVAALINANTTLYGVTAYASGVNHSGGIWFFANTLGSGGNAVTLAQSLSCTTKTLSGATLTGGAQPGITLLAVAKTGSGGKFMPVGLWDSGDVMQVSLGFWESGTGVLTKGVTANHYNTSASRVSAYDPAETGIEGTNWVFGAGAFMTGEVWAYRRHAALSAGVVSRNTSGATPGLLPTATGPLRIGKANGTNGLLLYPNGGDVAAVWVRNRFMTPMEIDADYAAIKANLLTPNGISI